MKVWKEKIAWKDKRSWEDMLRIPFQEWYRLIFLSLPVILTYILSYGLTIVNFMFLSRIGPAEQGGASLAVMFANVTGFSLMVGFITALDTLSSQANGAKEYHMLGIYLQRALVLCSIMFIPIALLWYNVEPVFTFLGQPPDAIPIAAFYMRALIFIMPPYYIYEVIRRTMQAQGVVQWAVLSSLVGLSSVIALNLVFVIALDWGIYGSAICIITAYIITLLSLILFTYLSGEYKKWWSGFSRECIRDLWPMLKIGIPGLVMVAAEWWAFEIQALLAGTFGLVTLDANNILSMTLTMVFMVPLGISVATTTRIGNHLGAGDAKRAKLCGTVALLFTGICVVTISICMVAGGELVPRLFTGYPDEPAEDASEQEWVDYHNKEDVVSLASGVLPLLALLVVFDALAGGTSSGILRGCGLQKIGAGANLVVYYVLGLPLGTFTAFYFDLELYGMWGGVVVATLISCIFFITLTQCVLNYRKISDRVIGELEKGEEPSYEDIELEQLNEIGEEDEESVMLEESR